MTNETAGHVARTYGESESALRVSVRRHTIYNTQYTVYNIQCTIWKLGHIWEDNIKMFLKEMGRSVDWNYLAHKRDKWRDLMSGLMSRLFQ